MTTALIKREFLDGQDYYVTYQMLDRVFANVYIVSPEDNKNFVKDLTKSCEKLSIFKNLNQKQLYSVVDTCVDFYVDCCLLYPYFDSEFKNGKLSWVGRKFKLDETFQNYPKRWFDAQGVKALNSLDEDQKELLFSVYREEDVFCDVKDKCNFIALNVTGAELEGLGLIDIKLDDKAKFGLRYEKTLFGQNALNIYNEKVKSKEQQNTLERKTDRNVEKSL